MMKQSQQQVNNNYSEQGKPQQVSGNGLQSYTTQESSNVSQKMTPISKVPGKDAPTSWAGRAFKALDSENRGYLFKHELLNQIKKGGVYTHHQLQTLINALEVKSPKDPIDFQEFEYLLSG